MLNYDLINNFYTKTGKWESEARQGFKHLLHYFEHNVIPDILKSYKITSGPGMQYIRELIK